jgi:hypothetical protein
VLLDFESSRRRQPDAGALADWLILGVLALIAVLTLELLARNLRLGFRAAALLLYALVWGYFTCFEGLRAGRRPANAGWASG